MSLTAQDERILLARARGLTQQAVAHLLGISPQTVKDHSTAIYRKLGVDSLPAALAAVGWLHVPGEPVVRCGWVGRCGRPIGHRGHHGGFRAGEG